MRPEALRLITALLPLLDESYADFHRHLARDWDLRSRYFPLTQLNSAEKEKRGAAIVVRLKEQIPIEELAKAAAEIICAPDETKKLLREIDVTNGSSDWQTIHRVTRRGLVREMAVRALLDVPTDEAIKTVADHVRGIMAAPFDSGAHFEHWESQDYFHNRALPDYWALLAALLPHPVAADLVRDLVTGCLKVAPPVDAKLTQLFNAFVYNSAYARNSLLRGLHAHKLLTFDVFRGVAQYEPGVVAFDTNVHRPYEPGSFEYAMREHNMTWARKVAADFKTQDIGFALRNFYHLKGAFYLLKACEHVERLGIKKLTPLDYQERAETALGRMAHIEDFEDGDEPDEIVSRLRQFKLETLQVALPVAGAAQELVLRALNQEKFLPLLQLIKQISGYAPHKGPYDWDIKNSSDAASGVLNLPQVRAVLSEVDEAEVKLFLNGLKQSKMGLDNTLMLLEAVSGWNQAEIQKKLEKRHQTAVKAFGLLPLREGEPETFERYLWLRRFAKESKQFGSQRRAAEAAAVEVALANLAQVAGYADTTQLEWAMEARLAQGGAEGSSNRAMIGDYQIEVAFEGEEAQLLIRRAGKTIKTAPPAVRASSEYIRLKELQSHLKSQRTRFRAALEEMMGQERALSSADIARMASLPAARPLLLKLIWADGTGRFGLFNDDFSQLRDVNGEAWTAQDTLFLAHPFALFGAGQLASWQRTLVRERIVQAFRQAFRELYVLTPAERETRTFSNRFAGHVVEPRRAARLLGGRGWRLDADGEFSVPEKAFPDAGLRACFDFADIGHFFSETDSITSDAVYFMPLDRPRHWDHRGKDPRVPLQNVPPKIFSEVMRDADLVVSVAQLGESGTLSGEAFERRGDIVRALVEDLGLPGVKVDGHFARVQGQLASYRVHLASGVIHIEPGNYLCIVPERGGAREKLFLPFADEDSKMSEVVSKILLLLRDDKINDETIVRQIQASRNAQV